FASRLQRQSEKGACKGRPFAFLTDRRTSRAARVTIPSRQRSHFSRIDRVAGSRAAISLLFATFVTVGVTSRVRTRRDRSRLANTSRSVNHFEGIPPIPAHGGTFCAGGLVDGTGHPIGGEGASVARV